MTYETILLETKERVAVITLNRPQALNALSIPMTDELVDCLTRLGTDPAVGAVVLTGSGRAFCAGGDIREMKASPEPEGFLKALALKLHNVISNIRRPPPPDIG